jgi:signal transduction histidine kinase
MHNFFKTNPPSPFITTIAYFSLNLATGLLAALLLFLFPNVSPFLLFLPTILFVAWYSGFLPGFITTVISMSIIVLLLFFPTMKPLLVASTNLLVEIVLFFVVGIFASYLIDKAKNQDLITDYQKRLRQNAHIIDTLESNFENAQKEIKSRDQFLAIASHELKTPVTSMLLQVQTAIHNIRNVSLANFSVANLLKMLEGTEQQSQRLSKMVNDLLNVSLITTGRIDLELEETDLSTVVKNVAENFSEKMKRENNSISVTAEKPIRGTWDKVRIEQAVSNLISNAIKYGNNKPIAITVSNSHERARLTVEDQGIGMSQEQQKRIFERFERAVNSKDYQGLGVGLYITSQIVKAHHGKIDVHSKPNDGTTFIIDLPLKQK